MSRGACHLLPHFPQVSPITGPGRSVTFAMVAEHIEHVTGVEVVAVTSVSGAHAVQRPLSASCHVITTSRAAVQTIADM